MKHALSRFAVLSLIVSSCSMSNDNRLPASAEAVLHGAAKLELFALDPEHLTARKAPVAPGDQLHGYAILGRATLTEASARKELVELVLRGIRESDGTVAACFNPRHGIRAEFDSKTLELVICYECLSMTAYGDALGAGVTRRGVLTISGVEPGVTKVFNSAGLQISAK